MLNRRVTRTILNTTEITASTNVITGGPLDFVLQDTDSLYLGYFGKFASRHFEFHTTNNNTSVMTAQYWDGSNWTDVDDFLDQTSVGGKTCAQDGFISWVNKSNWTKRSLTGIDSDIELFWIKLTVSADFSNNTKLHSILNLYSDNNLLKAYYPELVSDARYRPSGQTNLLPQHLAAKDLVVLRAKQRKLITDESQIIDINAVSVAAVHACAWILMSPIATSESRIALAEGALAKFNKEIGELWLDVDLNSDGKIDEAERKVLAQPFLARR